ncbi:MAG: hypothetical protein ACI85K_000013 [Hyphomicrobiaceae bacterium]|jgi:hypothetical protein
MGPALGFAGLAAIAGAAVWGLLRIYGDLEHGIIAWGIGGAIGFAIIKAGGYGQTLSIAGAVLAVLSIAAGKQISFQSQVNKVIEINLAEVDQDYATARIDAEAWVALGDSPSDDLVESYALDHDFEVDSAAQLRSEFAPEMERFVTEQPSQAEWAKARRFEVEAFVNENFTFIGYLREDFSILDILFVGFGLATAFGMVRKRTTELQTEAREHLRAERDPAQQAAAVAVDE